ncbi:MAG: FISUMP domain-containing protein, partial [Bacteroidota bacterium]
MKYDNNNQTPLAGIPVHLKTLLGNIVASDTTDSAGVYDMTGYNNGNYVLDATVNYVPGGINSTDALQVTRFFTSLITLSPLRAKAGDVNGNNITQSSDALLINRRITGVISAFSVGNFVNNLPSVSASGNPLMANLRVLSTGDVNGTYNPLSLAPALVLDTVYGNGNVGTAVVRFTTAGSGVFERGVVWSSSPNPTISSSKSVAGSGGFGFTHSFSSIDPNNIQYARAYARTSAGVYYSNERSFTPIPGLRCPGTPSVTDIDGNLYHTVQIGNQCWTQSNLKVSKYRNGDNIPTGLSNSAWANASSGAYAIYNNDPVNDGLYGKLYNHYAVTDSRGLCPTGYHVPTDAEWTTLDNQLGGSSVAGGALKGTILQPIPGGWMSPNIGATNSSGFTALPGGLRIYSGVFFSIPDYGYWWSYSDSSGSGPWFRSLSLTTSSAL